MLLQQVEKDFALVGFRVTFSACKNLEELRNQLTEGLRFFSINQPNTLVQLFYSIDISEDALNDLLQNKKEHYYPELSNTILLREAQKVILRTRYSN